MIFYNFFIDIWEEITDYCASLSMLSLLAARAYSNAYAYDFPLSSMVQNVAVKESPAPVVFYIFFGFGTFNFSTMVYLLR